jgi:hypothetical protein
MVGLTIRDKILCPWPIRLHLLAIPLAIRHKVKVTRHKVKVIRNKDKVTLSKAKVTLSKVKAISPVKVTPRLRQLMAQP